MGPTDGPAARAGAAGRALGFPAVSVGDL